MQFRNVIQRNFFLFRLFSSSSSACIDVSQITVGILIVATPTNGGLTFVKRERERRQTTNKREIASNRLYDLHKLKLIFVDILPRSLNLIKWT